jgi:hypothetical protein
MQGTGRSQQLLAWFRVLNFAGDLELHLAFKHGYQLVGGVAKVFPGLARWISPQVAAKAPGSPVSGDLVTVGLRHGGFS